MAQVRQPFRANSPIHSALRPLPETSRSRRSSLHEAQRTEPIKSSDQQSRSHSLLRTNHRETFEAPSLPSRLGPPTIHHRTGYSNSSNEAPKVPPRSIDQHHSMPEREQQIQSERTNEHQASEIDESFDLPSLDDDDGLPVVSIDGRNLPVYARFPFDVTFLPQPMETNVEDNIHRLRLRLIDSELDQQRRTTEEYFKRTHEQIPVSSSRSRDTSLYPIRPPPTSISTQRLTPKHVSRQASYANLSNGRVPSVHSLYPRISRGRMGIDYEPPMTVENQRDLEIRPVPDWYPSGGVPLNRTVTNPPLAISNYTYDSRLYNESGSLLERQYTSSNMDDLIDSMARRQLASRRYDSSLDRTRFITRPYGTFYESGSLPRQTSVLNSHRHDDIYLINGTPMATTHIDRGFLRPYPPEINLNIRPRFDNSDYTNSETFVPRTAYSKLPPITPTHENQSLDNSNDLTNSALYQAKHSPTERQSNAVPMNLPDHTEHFIDLPSDIFLSARTEVVGSPKLQQNENRQSEIRPISRTKSVEKVERSDFNRQAQTPSENHFFTEEKPKIRPNRFKKAARAIIFLRVAQRKAAKTRRNPARLTTSATIHKLRLQEVLVALHRVYLEPDGPICNTIYQTINCSIDLRDAFTSSKLNFTMAHQILGEAMKTITSRLVDFMPKDGVLGTSKSSSLAAIIQDGNPFPDNFFWQTEKALLEFERSKIINVTKQRAILLLIGTFILRGLVTTLLIKPVKYRLLLGELTETQKANTKIFASVLFYLGRRTAGFNSQILAMPHEWKSFVYSDDELDPILKHNEVQPILIKCELSLRLWCEEYIRRIDTSFGHELRA